MRLITAWSLTLLVAVSCGKKDVPESDATASHQFSDEEIGSYNSKKLTGLENVLGPAHDVVGHAPIPWSEGGLVDMYYFTNGIPGTGMATMQLIKPDGSGSVPNDDGTYELLAFTKLNFNSDTSVTNSFNQIERRMNKFFTSIANYAMANKIQPGETTEIPEDGSVTRYLVFDAYKPGGKEFMIGGKKHGLLLIIEIHREELEFATQYGSSELLKRLKDAGHYPYSDLERKPVAEFESEN